MQTIRSIEENEDMNRSYKRLKLGGGQALQLFE
jgi:hypothetical protein